MKIGIDLDGVVIDSETTFRTYEEIFDIDILKGNNLINKKNLNFKHDIIGQVIKKRNLLKNIF